MTTVHLAHEERGAGDPPMLFLHGMACVRQDMDLLIDDFAADHRCVAFDMRGHGASDVPVNAYATTDFTDDIGRMIDDRGLDRPVLVGHSFGGSASLVFADAYPERVRALVMLDSGLRSSATVGADLNPFYDALRVATPEQYRVIVEDFVRTWLFDPVDDPAIVAQVSAQMGKLPVYVFLSMAETVTSFDSAGRLCGSARCRRSSSSHDSRSSTPPCSAMLGDNWDSGRVVLGPATSSRCSCPIRWWR